MNIMCVECGHNFQLPESKIPSSAFQVKCPACKKVFQVSVQKPDSNLETPVKPAPSNGKVAPWEQVKPEVEGLIKTQLDAIRNDILLSLASLPGRASRPAHVNPGGYGEKSALICEADSVVAQQLMSVLQRMSYSVQVCSLVSEALSRLEGGFYDVIITDVVFPDDPEGCQKILSKVNARKQDERRRMFLIVVSDQMKTIGPHAAFFQGANIFIQKSDLRDFENLLKEGLRYFTEIYGNFYELLEESSERL